MNAEVNAVPGSGPEAVAIATVGSATRPFYWSVRRELWEHRALFIAPLVPAGIVLLFVLLGAFNLASGVHFTGPTTPGQYSGLLGGMLGTTAMLIMVVATLTAFFYCLDALYGERRDRSILFWKSLPVSDLTAVLSKVFIPAVAVPVIVFAVVAATSVVILLVATAVLLVKGTSPVAVLSAVPVLQMTIGLLYVLAGSALWYAPVYGWLLLVSAWARRSTFLWAVMPPLAVCLVERLAFASNHFWLMLRDRLVGVALRSHFDLATFLATPALWIGLVVAAAFIAAAVWMRRYREPL